MIFTHHPRSRFERRMHQRREQQKRRTWQRKSHYPLRWVPAAIIRVPGTQRSERRRWQQRWSYYVVHNLARGPVPVD